MASNVDSPSKGSGSPSKRSKELTSINLAQSSDVQPKDRMNPVRQELSPDGRDVAFGTDGDRASPTDKRFLLGLFHDAEATLSKLGSQRQRDAERTSC